MSTLIPPHRPGLPARCVHELIEHALLSDPGVNAEAIIGLGHCVLAVRGYFRKSFGPTLGNDVGYFDDAIILADLKTGQCLPFNGNTDPSRLGYNALLDKGYAILQPGVWLFHQGAHKGKAPAWRQADEEAAHRLRYERFFTDYRADGSFAIWRGDFGKKPETGYFAINAHWATYGTSSAGCQTLPGEPNSGQWAEFRKASYANFSRLLPWVLIDNDGIV